MALNEIFAEGDNMSRAVPANTPSGAPVRIGVLNGVTQTAEGEGGNPAGFATVKHDGVHEFQVSFAIASVGLPVYITAANVLTATASGNFFYGAAESTKAAAAGPLRVNICKFWPTASA